MSDIVVILLCNNICTVYILIKTSFCICKFKIMCLYFLVKLFFVRLHNCHLIFLKVSIN